MRTTWEKIVHHFGTTYGHYISNEMHKKSKFTIPKPGYTEYVQSKHKQHVGLFNLDSARLSKEREAKRVILNQEVEDGNDPEAPIKMAILENDIDEAIYKTSIDLAIHLTDAEKTEHDNAWRIYRERVARP